MGKGKKKGGGGGASDKTKAKSAAKIIEDKTFGLKNKNKSKKVQKYVQQIQNQVSGGGKRNMSAAAQQAAAAKKKADKEARKQAELEMFKLLGDAYKPKKKSKKTKKKEQEQAAEKEAEQKAKQQAEDERDFGIPMVALQDVFHLESKARVERICAVLEHKDNLVTKTKDGQDSIFLRVADGTTLNPMNVQIIGENPTSFEHKVGHVLDVRNATAMVRGDKVFLEITKGSDAEILAASERLTEHVQEKKEENDAIRAQGGIPIEQLIEEQRAQLSFENLTPVTKERFFAWKEKKRKAKEAAWEEKRQAAAKKSGGKGLNVLSGRALFAYDSSLFKDDDAALDNQEYDVVEDQENEQDNNKDEDGQAEQTTEVSVDGTTVQLEEQLYLDDDDDLDDLDDDSDNEE